MMLDRTLPALIAGVLLALTVKLPSQAEPRRDFGSNSSRPSQMTDSSESYGDLVVALKQEIDELKRQRKESSELLDRLKNRVQRFEERLNACCPE